MEKKIPIYVQEALTPRIRHIFMEAKNIAREKQFKYTWIKEGKVFMRNGDRILYIKQLAMLKSL
jgi:hypothetical protein